MNDDVFHIYFSGFQFNSSIEIKSVRMDNGPTVEEPPTNSSDAGMSRSGQAAGNVENTDNVLHSAMATPQQPEARNSNAGGPQVQQPVAGENINNPRVEHNNNVIPGVPTHPLFNVRDRLFHALFFRMATVYARAVPPPFRTLIEYGALMKVVIFCLVLLLLFFHACIVVFLISNFIDVCSLDIVI